MWLILGVAILVLACYNVGYHRALNKARPIVLDLFGKLAEATKQSNIYRDTQRMQKETIRAQRDTIKVLEQKIITLTTTTEEH